MTEKKPKQIFASSALACIICNSLTNPLDVIKVRLQNDAKRCTCCAHPSHCVNRASPIEKSHSITNASVYKLVKCRNLQTNYQILCDCLPFKTNVKALIYLIRKEGFLTLTNGIYQGVMASSVSAITFFSFYEAARKRVIKHTQNSVLVPFLSALSARSLTTSLIFPFEYCKTVQQSSIGVSKAPILNISKSVSAGYTSLMMRDCVFACVNWIIAENIREEIKRILGGFGSQPKSRQVDVKGRVYQDKQTLLISNFIAGGIAGGFGSTMSIPFDVVKTRKQLHPKEYRNKSIGKILKEVYQNEGKKGLFLGARQRIWKIIISSAGILTLYEFFMDTMGAGQLEAR